VCIAKSKKAIPIGLTGELPVNDDTETSSSWKRFNTRFLPQPETEGRAAQTRKE
jgi:hypothetical protein